LKFKADFSSKISVCRHELGVEPPAIPTPDYCVDDNKLWKARVLGVVGGLEYDDRGAD